MRLPALGSCSCLWLMFGPGTMPSGAEPPRPELQPRRSRALLLDLPTDPPPPRSCCTSEIHLKF